MLLLATEIWKSHGGIQRYMRMMIRILSDRGEPFAALTLLDDDESRPSEASDYCRVCSGNKWRFGWEALQLGLKDPKRQLIVGHVGLLPVAWLLWRLQLVENYTVVLHGLEAWYRHSWLTRKAARGASCIVATTTYTAREFCYLNGLDAKRCIVIPLATDSRTPAMLPAAPEGHMRLLAVSRLSTADRYKGIDILLRAIRMGLDEGLALRLDIVGDGNDASRLKDLTERLGIQNSVTFRGSVPDEDLDQLYRSSHVFVMPSKKEGFGIVFLEAMAVGLPCIGGNHGGTPEVIHHGVSGYLVEFGDIEQLVFYFRVIGESAELYSLLSRAARHRAMRVLGFDNMAKSWDELIDRLKALGNGNSNAEEISPSCPAPEES